jgi:hypothetical protein
VGGRDGVTPRRGHSEKFASEKSAACDDGNGPFIPGSDEFWHASGMIRTAVAGLAAAMLSCLPAYAQEVELEGAPGYRAAQEQAARQAAAQKQAAQKQAAQKQAQAAADKVKADQAKLARQTETQKAEQARLAKQAEDLDAREAKLKARAAELAAEEKRLAQAREDLETEQANARAELARLREETGRPAPAEVEIAESSGEASQPAGGNASAEDEPNAVEEGDDWRVAPGGDRRRTLVRANFDQAERSCTRAAQGRALDRGFYSARYDGPPHIYEDGGLELRGRMRLQDRRGYMLVDTVCEVDGEGEARRFIFLR